jgi:hypothetical protein
LALVSVPSAAQAEKRIALVIGNAGYQAGALATPANDAGLIAQTLQAAGFDVVGARPNRLKSEFVDVARIRIPGGACRGIRCIGATFGVSEYQ